MPFSRPLKSSAHATPSPDGTYIATVIHPKLILRSTRSLEILRVITLPSEISAALQWFLWSPSSGRILICASDCICVYSMTNLQFAAKISNPTSGTAKITSVAFGITEDEINVWSDFGLKLSIFNLSTSRSVDIASPKFYNQGNFARGCSVRPHTSTLALITRSGGKDIISVHAKVTYEVLRSWNSDTIDAQGLSWSTDGRWLAVVDSAGQGHRVLFYTTDGHLFRVWNGPIPTCDEERDLAMGAGVRMLEWASTIDCLAIGDYSPKVTVLSTPSFMRTLSLQHTTTIKPVGGLQIYQEHVTPSQSGGFDRKYVSCTNPIFPPTVGSSPAASDPHTKLGTNILSFDASGTLMATRTEIMPTTIWIWDIASKGLKAVLVQHAPVAKLTWHPRIPELLMIRCEGEDSKGLVHLWDPTWENPQILDFASQLAEGKILGKSVARWLNYEGVVPAVFFSDSQDCILASLADADDEDLPWQDSGAGGFDINGLREESPLNLVPAGD